MFDSPGSPESPADKSEVGVNTYKDISKKGEGRSKTKHPSYPVGWVEVSKEEDESPKAEEEGQCPDLPEDVEEKPSPEEDSGFLSSSEYGLRIYNTYLRKDLLDRAESFNIADGELCMGWTNKRGDSRSKLFKLPSDCDEIGIMKLVEKWIITYK